jgi:hypothetical protein
MNKRHFRQHLLAFVLGVCGVSGTALAVNEAESNNLLNSAQQLSEGSDLSVTRNGETVYGAIAQPSPMPDVDFYTFYGKEGQKLTIHIQDTGTFNAVLTVVGPSYKVKAEKVPTVQGQQVRIEDFLLDETGMWAVVVTPSKILIGNPQATSFGSLVASGSRIFAPTSGNYTLVITPATPPVQPIGIEIKPGSGERAPINPKARGVIPVALLAAADFDPFKVDVSSLTFGATGDERSLRRCAEGGLDVDGDGDLDRVCTFENQAAMFTEESTMGYLKGQTSDGSPFQGQGFLKASPAQGK